MFALGCRAAIFSPRSCARNFDSFPLSLLLVGPFSLVSSSRKGIYEKCNRAADFLRIKLSLGSCARELAEHLAVFFSLVSSFAFYSLAFFRPRPSSLLLSKHSHAPPALPQEGRGTPPRPQRIRLRRRRRCSGLSLGERGCRRLRRRRAFSFFFAPAPPPHVRRRGRRHRRCHGERPAAHPRVFPSVEWRQEGSGRPRGPRRRARCRRPPLRSPSPRRRKAEQRSPPSPASPRRPTGPTGASSRALASPSWPTQARSRALRRRRRNHRRRRSEARRRWLPPARPRAPSSPSSPLRPQLPRLPLTGGAGEGTSPRLRLLPRPRQRATRATPSASGTSRSTPRRRSRASRGGAPLWLGGPSSWDPSPSPSAARSLT